MVPRRSYLFDGVGLAVLLHLTRSEATTARLNPVGVGTFQAICDPLSPERNCLLLDHDMGAGLVKALESSGRATVGSIYLGNLSCDSLDEANDSTRVRFVISSNQTIVAKRTSYSVVPGELATDNADRKVWMGNIVEPAPSSGALPGSISMTWTTPCDVESFFLRMVKRRTRRGASILTSIPCGDGVCLVEQDVLFQLASRPIQSDTLHNRRLNEADSRGGGRELKEMGVEANLNTATQSRRRLQNTTEIDVLCFYSEEVRVNWGNLTSVQMESRIKTYFVEVNEGNSNSLIPLTYNVFVRPLPYDQEVDSEDVLEGITHSPAVSLLRNDLGADLVHIIADTDDTCGVAWMFAGPSSGFGLTHFNCIDDFTLGHELGHNLGCNHDRDVEEDDDHPYAYGQRHCTGEEPYITIMAYVDDCEVDYVNYYSNPDVVLFGKPTGTAIENCARRIMDTMGAVAGYRQTGGGGCVSTGEACSSTSDCCDSTCDEGVCGPCINAGQQLGDGYCNYGLNTDVCGWDLGDCCECSCVGPCTTSSTSSSSTEYSYSDDTRNDYDLDGQAFDCLDPDPICIECTEDRALIGNGVCNEETNNAGCLYDGGDCCEYSCGVVASSSSSWSWSSYSSSPSSSSRSYYSSLCGSSGYDCIDPEACSGDGTFADCDDDSSTIGDESSTGASRCLAFSPYAVAISAATAAGSAICAFRGIEGFM